jgi:hypothetical protein
MPKEARAFAEKAYEYLKYLPEDRALGIMKDLNEQGAEAHRIVLNYQSSRTGRSTRDRLIDMELDYCELRARMDVFAAEALMEIKYEV